MRLFPRAVVCLCLLSPGLFAQGDRGTITGIITDPAGAVVPNATIEARNVDTGGVFPVQSSSTGNYTISSLPAGQYEVTVKVMGFKTFTRKGLRVEVAQTLPVDIPLELGSTGDSVTVSNLLPGLKSWDHYNVREWRDWRDCGFRGKPGRVPVGSQFRQILIP